MPPPSPRERQHETVGVAKQWWGTDNGGSKGFSGVEGSGRYGRCVCGGARVGWGGGGIYSALMTMGLDDTVSSFCLRCASVTAFMAPATALAGSITGP